MPLQRIRVYFALKPKSRSQILYLENMKLLLFGFVFLSIIASVSHAGDKWICTTCGQTASQPYTSGCRENQSGKHTWVINASVSKVGGKWMCTDCGQTASQPYTSGCRENQGGKHTWVIKK
jgi:hypothetical protein